MSNSSSNTKNIVNMKSENNVNSLSDFASLSDEVSKIEAEEKTESGAEIAHSSVEELSPVTKSCDLPSNSPTEPKTTLSSDIETIAQYSETEYDSLEEYDMDIVKFKGDKRRGKKKFKLFRNIKTDKYLDGSDYVCVSKKDDKCKDNMYIELPTVHRYQLLPKEAIRKAAKKEAEIMILMEKIGVNCPKLVYRNNHILATTFIGDPGRPALKLTEITMEPYQWQHIYTEVIEAIYKMYNRGKVIHGRLSPRNILWWQNKCWFIDFSHAFTGDNVYEGFRVLFSDCKVLSEFFKEKGAEPESGEYLFTHVTGEENWWANTFQPHTQTIVRPTEADIM